MTDDRDLSKHDTAYDLASCPSCGTVEWRTRSFCSSCGTAMPARTVLPPFHPARALAKRLVVGITGLGAGPVILYFVPNLAGLLLGLFAIMVGSVVGVIYLIYGGVFPDVHRRVWTIQKATTSSWLQYGGPAAAAGLDAQASINDTRKRPELGD